MAAEPRYDGAAFDAGFGDEDAVGGNHGRQPFGDGEVDLEGAGPLGTGRSPLTIVMTRPTRTRPSSSSHSPSRPSPVMSSRVNLPAREPTQCEISARARCGSGATTGPTT